MNNGSWVDLQVNGHNGVDYSSPELTADGIVRSIEELAEAGTAVFLPTLVTSSEELYCRNLPPYTHLLRLPDICVVSR